MNALLKQFETRMMPVQIRNTDDSPIGHFLMAFIVMRPLDIWLSGIYNVILYYAYPTVMVIKQMKSQNGFSYKRHGSPCPLSFPQYLLW